MMGGTFFLAGAGGTKGAMKGSPVMKGCIFAWLAVQRLEGSSWRRPNRKSRKALRFSFSGVKGEYMKVLLVMVLMLDVGG